MQIRDKIIRCIIIIDKVIATILQNLKQNPNHQNKPSKELPNRSSPSNKNQKPIFHFHQNHQ